MIASEVAKSAGVSANVVRYYSRISLNIFASFKGTHDDNFKD